MRLPSFALRGNLQDGRVLFQDAEGDSLDVLTQLPVGFLLRAQYVHDLHPHKYERAR